MTRRLYYTDSHLLEFDATVTDARDGGLRVVLDETAFYPTSGGQPFDTGTLNGVRVVDVVEEDDGSIVHVLEKPLPAGAVHGAVDAERRHDHRQQHTGQHLLSAVFEEMYRMKTLSFHLGAESSTIDLETPELKPPQIAAVEKRANEIVFEGRPVSAGFEHAAEAQGLRKATEREGEIRVVSIEGIDRSACGGTHVRSTGEIGPILIRKLDKIRGNVRVEFLCGLRAVRQARTDFETLSAISRLFSAPAEQTPELLAARLEEIKELSKEKRKLALELAKRRGAEMYEAAAMTGAGRRLHEETVPKGPFDDELRAFAQSFVAQPQAVFVAVAEQPPAVLLAVSADSGLDAGQLMKSALASAGGRGGGNAQLAQGSVPTLDAARAIAQKLSYL